MQRSTPISNVEPGCQGLPATIRTQSQPTNQRGNAMIRIAFKLYDMSIDNREHNPIVMTQRGDRFFVGTFGEEGENGGKSELAVFDKHFSGYALPFKSRDPIVGLAWHRDDLYAVEIFPYDNQWAPIAAADTVTGRIGDVFGSLISHSALLGRDDSFVVSKSLRKYYLGLT
jgi:hypothetical protein